MKRKPAFALASAILCTAAFAAPAPWFLWRSKLNGKTFCTQTSPGTGWERLSGPYRDVRCEKPGMPGAMFKRQV